MTPAAHRYINKLYEDCVNTGLDVEAIRRTLLRKGVSRTPHQVVHDLDNVYCYYGCAASHLAPPPIPLSVIDKEIDRKKP